MGTQARVHFRPMYSPCAHSWAPGVTPRPHRAPAQPSEWPCLQGRPARRGRLHTRVTPQHTRLSKSCIATLACMPLYMFGAGAYEGLMATLMWFIRPP